VIHLLAAMTMYAGDAHPLWWSWVPFPRIPWSIIAA